MATPMFSAAARAALVLVGIAVMAGSSPAQTVRAPAGTVAGTPGADPGFAVFRGIPYAAPPVGGLRWKPPEASPRWPGVRRAAGFAPDCLSTRPTPGSAAPEQSEDCLYLNIWTPAPSPAKRPVMVWIYGGAFAGGSPAVPRYDGTGLNRKGVIFVSFGYRTGLFGFLSHPLLSAESPRHVSGNYGLLDALAALRWVRRNIAAFGGDPDNVTIFGQSSGSETVNALTLSPLAKGLFARAIGESGGGFGQREPMPLATAASAGAAYAAPLGTTLAALRARSAADLLAAVGGRHFEPVVDGWFLPADAHGIYARGRPNDVPTLVGSNADEGQLSATLTRDAYRARVAAQFGRHAPEVLAAFPAADDAEARRSAKALQTVLLGDFNTASWADGQLRTGRAPVWQYRFEHAPPPGLRPPAPAGAYHGAEIFYAFNNLHTEPRAWTAADRALEAELSSYWTNFARTGDPNGPGLPRWTPLRSGDARVLAIGDAPAMAPRPNAALIARLTDIFYGPDGLYADAGPARGDDRSRAPTSSPTEREAPR